ncbi:unnamed protein product [Ceutorhynchus assimilis]|uniref:PHD-type domain-containing protein n=1 Tax=Ceutorhynchus assimilis TaxID=467358 RepID=A0A9N9MFH7_9CUCU|nr:unnamed protein product [Ceutorhynchus assimilis]
MGKITGSKGGKNPNPVKFQPQKKVYVCPDCTNNVTKTQHSICCGQCSEYYHKNCSKLTSLEFTAYAIQEMDELWVCSKCSNPSESEDGSDSEAEKTKRVSNKRLSQCFGPSTTNLGNRDPAPKRSVGGSDKMDIEDVVKIFNERFEKFEESLNFKWQIIEGTNKMVKDIQKENKQLKRGNEAIQKRVKELETKVELLVYKQEKEQLQTKKKNIIFSGPLLTKENICGTVKKVFQAVHVSLQESEYKSTILPSAREEKPILLQFSSEETRNKIIEARKKVQNLDTVLCGFTGPQKKVYISEDLDKKTREVKHVYRTINNKLNLNLSIGSVGHTNVSSSLFNNLKQVENNNMTNLRYQPTKTEFKLKDSLIQFKVFLEN